MSKSSNFIGQPTWWHGRMDKTAAHHRFNDRKDYDVTHSTLLPGGQYHE